MVWKESIRSKPLGDLAPEVAEFFHYDTNTFSYVVSDPTTTQCAIIDCVADFDAATGTLSYQTADHLLRYLDYKSLDPEWLIETHVHADHISAAPYIRQRAGGKIAISHNITQVQTRFARLFNAGNEFPTDGSQFDHLFQDGENYTIGNLSARAIPTPGHTPACMTHLIGDAAFVGDTLFMPDQGTARADFPGGSASDLYDSIQTILSLPKNTRLFVCHDYSTENPHLAFETTVADELEENIHINRTVNRESFVTLREARDKTLAAPRYILPSLQVNMRAGHLPDPEGNGISYLKIPINSFGKSK